MGDSGEIKEPGINGLMNLREDIARNKMRFELVDDAEQIVLKNKIMDNVQKYFYRIVFTVYLREMIEKGKEDLKWERDIPEAAWEVLVDMADEDFDENLGCIIKNIFTIAHSLFSDLPAGPDKKRATYRFASKTLLKLLPSRQKSEVDMLISKKRMALDLYDILGHCTWYK